MNVDRFLSEFEQAFPASVRLRATWRYQWEIVRRRLDPCVDVDGFTALKNQRLLNLAAGHLPPGEAYLEVGVFKGKTLISALLGNEHVIAYACDNFSQFGQDSEQALRDNLDRYALTDRVTLLSQDFRSALTPAHVRHPVGVYFNDGAHDFQSQFDGIRLAEPLLASEALVIVDDWTASDASFCGRAATLEAIRESPHEWVLLQELPARMNGDRAMWWNGVGILSFRRKSC